MIFVIKIVRVKVNDGVYYVNKVNMKVRKILEVKYGWGRREIKSFLLFF